MTSSTMLRKALVGLSLALAAATPAVAQVTIGTAPDANVYYGDFGVGSAGGTATFAQTFQVPTGASNQLQSFTLYLGDLNEGGTGNGLTFRAGVYAVSGNQLASAPLFLSSVRNGSGNFSGFDAYTFLTPNLTLTPSNGLFALVLQAVGSSSALNVIGGTSGSYSSGALFAASTTGLLAAQAGTADAAFSATFAPALSAVPEPATLVLVSTGLFGIAGLARRRRARG